MHDSWYYVYMVQSSSRRALYIGVTRSLERRIAEHKSGSFEGFTADYHASRLVYSERFGDIRDAIAREKQLKGWRREKKEMLIQKLNPSWRDLSAEWGNPIERPRWAVRDPLDRAVSGCAAADSEWAENHLSNFLVYRLSSRAERSGAEGPCVSLAV